MYRRILPKRSSIVLNQSTEGETIEQKIERIVVNKEPITDGAPIIHTLRSDGVQPAYDIRTDRFEIAVEATDAIAKTHLAKRDSKIIDINNPKPDENNTGESKN